MSISIPPPPEPHFPDQDPPQEPIKPSQETIIPQPVEPIWPPTEPIWPDEPTTSQKIESVRGNALSNPERTDSKKTFAGAEAKDIASPEIAKELFKFIEDKEEPFSAGLKHDQPINFEKARIAISSENPFFDTDLIVLQDDYSGPLPLNGILQKDFEKITKFYHDLIQGKTKFVIDKNDPYFQEQIHLFIKNLLTRPTGRNLIFLTQHYQRTGNPHDEKIYIKAGSESLMHTFIKEEEDHKHYNQIEISIALLDTRDSVMAVNAQRRRLPTPDSKRFIDLGHELIHALHHLQGTYSPFRTMIEAPKDVRMDNIEEEETITPEPFTPFQASSEEELEEKFLAEFFSEADQSFFREQITENSLRSDFSENIRIDHRGVIKKIPLNQLNIQSPEGKEYVRKIVAAGFLNEVKELKEGGFLKDIYLHDGTFDGRTLSQLAAQCDCLDVLKYLLENGASAYMPDFKGKTLLYYAIFSKNVDMINYLITEKRLNPNQLDNDGWSVFHYVALLPFSNPFPVHLFEALANAGADPNLMKAKDKKGNNFEQFMFENHRTNQAVLDFIEKKWGIKF